MTRRHLKNSKIRSIEFSPIIKENLNFLRKIHENKRSHLKIRQILIGARDEELLTLVEICFNLLKSRIPLSKRHHKLLKKQAIIVRKLARSRSAKTSKSLLLKSVGQRGDGLPLVPAILSSVILPILTETIISKINK